MKPISPSRIIELLKGLVKRPEPKIPHVNGLETTKQSFSVTKNIQTAYNQFVTLFW